MMTRTQIYLPTKVHRNLTRIAERKNVPMAEIVRLFIEDGLQGRKEDSAGHDTMRAIARLGFKGGPRDLSKRMDHYLYGSNT